MSRFWLLMISLVPLLGATRTIVQAISISLCACLLTGLHQALMAPLRRHLAQGASLWASAVMTASLVTCLHLGLRAWTLPLAEELAPYPLLLALPCLACEQLLPQQYRYRQLCRGLGGLLVAGLALGACRQVLADDLGLHIATLAPGALILLGLLLGLYNHLRPSTTSPSRQGSR
ncbi:electron transport complex protein RnfE [Pseudomonas sp. TE6288]|uniref:Rnf-Nqr domain containing protein n=1 Tax=unclassified Pseudomonas TaxID=196821 RepID=UPI000C88E96F|nr:MULTISPECIES: Rnf-Nqr domain containing protein [unclassified Pseudomonas]MBI6955363.1 NADH:quinone oxidoreductase [Pseudomonas sp. CCOS 191]PMZ91238.1 NADH:quinone oxidoreductase [Pseudomonas sp. FW305-42]PNA20260.1 NADH:quinone oxidoreductase [Pseudomonas sp. MPR-R1B]PNB24468.1 NADH:quinone oxidoreductase [Pseudomonas sp. DP16D-E2]PNB40847.1 NADH:quinone oxidoreductase [Pseudomonas sp. FW305-17]